MDRGIRVVKTRPRRILDFANPGDRMKFIRDRYRGDTAAKCLLYTIALYAGENRKDEGNRPPFACWVGIDSLARDTGMCRSNVSKLRRQLVEEHWLEVVEEGGGYKRATMVRITVPPGGDDDELMRRRSEPPRDSEHDRNGSVPGDDSPVVVEGLDPAEGTVTCGSAATQAGMVPAKADRDQPTSTAVDVDPAPSSIPVDEGAEPTSTTVDERAIFTSNLRPNYVQTSSKLRPPGWTQQGSREIGKGGTRPCPGAREAQPRGAVPPDGGAAAGPGGPSSPDGPGHAAGRSWWDDRGAAKRAAERIESRFLSVRSVLKDLGKWITLAKTLGANDWDEAERYWSLILRRCQDDGIQVEFVRQIPTNAIQRVRSEIRVADDLAAPPAPNVAPAPRPPLVPLSERRAKRLQGELEPLERMQVTSGRWRVNELGDMEKTDKSLATGT